MILIFSFNNCSCLGVGPPGRRAASGPSPAPRELREQGVSPTERDDMTSRTTGSTNALADDTATRPATRDVRCHCGSLVARIIDGELELKCRRCQRIALVSLRAADARSGEVEMRWLSDGAARPPR
jgi:phage FluMu protein Com